MLHKKWKDILRKAWSIRLMVLAGLLSGLEVILPMFSDSIPRNAFALLSMMTIGGAFVSRIVVQNGMGDDE